MHSAPTAPATVTIVDDEPAVLDVLVRAARSWHYCCQSAISAEQALKLFEASPSPLLVTDLRMPGRGGLWLVREVRRRWPRTAITVITAGNDTDTAIECLNAGAKRYFLKPVNLDEFHHALDLTHQTYRLERAEEEYRRRLEDQVARQTRKIRRTFLDAIDMMVSTLEARDPYTCGHSHRVRDYSLRLARALGFAARERKQLSLAAKLHDVGKLGVPEHILNKPDRLTGEEFEVIRRHPLIGERILSTVIHSRAVLSAIRGHHERLDGAGYPDGLAGPHLPPLARIIAIADTFDALTSSRAYRAALSRRDALAVIEDAAGTQFDPLYVRTFLNCFAAD
jgi:putative two-component system response regulator